MDIDKELRMIATDTWEYRTDPQHQNRPKGLGWETTQKGWKRKTREVAKPSFPKKAGLNLVAEFRKLAAEIMADNKDYRYDPEHKNRPEGGGWKETDSGWSRGTGEQEHKKEMSKSQKIPDIEQKPSLTQSQPTKPQEVTTPSNADITQQKREVLWPQALPSEAPKPSPYSEMMNKPEIKRMRKDISINPNTVFAKLSENKEYVPFEHKENLAKLYKSWLSENEGAADEEGKQKAETVRNVLKMIQPPKFKKIQPKLTQGSEYLVRDNDLGDELQELAGFKDIIKHHPQMSDKEYKRRIEEKIRLPRSQQQLKTAFVQHMNPQNYPSMDAFNAAKKRVQAMSVADFGKLLASIVTDEDEELNG